MTDHTELRDRIRRAVYERLAHGPSAPDVLDPIADAALYAIDPLLRELDEGRAENERLRDEIQRLRIEPAGYMHAATNEVFEAEDLVVITPDGPAAIADTTCHGASSCKSPVHFDSCMSETPGERIPDHRNALVDRVQVFYDDDTHSEVIEAPRAQAEWTPTPGERVRVRGHRDHEGGEPVTEMILSAAQERAIRHALMDLPKICQYHGSNFTKLGTWQGTPNCESCRVPYRAKVAWDAFTAALDRRDTLTTEPTEETR